ncbi:beta-1,3-glucanase family protein [Mariniluteicoccus flavus]
MSPSWARATGPGLGFAIPRHFSGRVYFSVGAKLQFGLVSGGLIQPAPWDVNDPNSKILFDWSELTFDNGGLFLNSTQVDQLAIPHQVGVTGTDVGTRVTGRLKPGGRRVVVDALRATPGYAGSVMTDAQGRVLRVLAPGKATAVGRMNANLLDSGIASAWQAYATRTLTIVPDAGNPGLRFVGRTVGSQLVFTDVAGQRVAVVDRPSTHEVWECSGRLAAPNATVGLITRTLCAALNRGTLGDVAQEPVLNAAAFYTDAQSNQYARVLHAAAVDTRAYAFPFDDVAGQESLVHSAQRTAAVGDHRARSGRRRARGDADADADREGHADPAPHSDAEADRGGRLDHRAGHGHHVL